MWLAEQTHKVPLLTSNGQPCTGHMGRGLSSWWAERQGESLRPCDCGSARVLPALLPLSIQLSLPSPFQLPFSSCDPRASELSWAACSRMSSPNEQLVHTKVWLKRNILLHNRKQESRLKMQSVWGSNMLGRASVSWFLGKDVRRNTPWTFTKPPTAAVCLCHETVVWFDFPWQN